METPYDALLLVGFGGPERREDVIPFLENVLRGRNVPHERMLEVAEHYYHFGGVSPINAQMRELKTALEAAFAVRSLKLPIYWGNRNWHPRLPDTLREMAGNGVRRALAYVASAYSSYSSCRQYRENIEQAQAAVGPAAPQVDKLRAFFNHPLFVATTADQLDTALREIPRERLASTQVVFTAHSIPLSMARTSQYEQQLKEACRLTAEVVGWPAERWQLVYQSRSGRPEDPWLEPDILDYLRGFSAEGGKDVVVLPIGFLTDHMEVLYDLDYEARQVAGELGLNMIRAATVGTHPLFVQMICELVEERLFGKPAPAAMGQYPASHDVCPLDCCPAPQRPIQPAPSPRNAPLPSPPAGEGPGVRG